MYVIRTRVYTEDDAMSMQITSMDISASVRKTTEVLDVSVSSKEESNIF